MILEPLIHDALQRLSARLPLNLRQDLIASMLEPAFRKSPTLHDQDHLFLYELIVRMELHFFGVDEEIVEYTLPAPCFRSAKCRRYWEVGMFCRAFGGVGCACADRRRGGIMLFAFAMSAVAWVFVPSARAARSTVETPNARVRALCASDDEARDVGVSTHRGRAS